MKDDETDPKARAVSRRRMLQRLGLAAGVIYAAPVLTGLNAGRASSLKFTSFSSLRRVRRRRPRWSIPTMSIAQASSPATPTAASPST